MSLHCDANDEEEFDRLSLIINEVKAEAEETPEPVISGKRPRVVHYEASEESFDIDDSEDSEEDILHTLFEKRCIDMTTRISLCRTYANYLTQCLKIKK